MKYDKRRVQFHHDVVVILYPRCRYPQHFFHDPLSRKQEDYCEPPENPKLSSTFILIGLILLPKLVTLFNNRQNITASDMLPNRSDLVISLLLYIGKKIKQLMSTTDEELAQPGIIKTLQPLSP